MKTGDDGSNVASISRENTDRTCKPLHLREPLTDRVVTPKPSHLQRRASASELRQGNR
uniref:Uncharacterized protein n=1 Tax=Brassica oleracea TaxID=3712 RepID=A0A3P6ED28_BRAOL|nr:unnamed protein product [Brassica oleracea]